MKIICAMSGGVDSSVAALLLKQQGHEVIGVSMKLRDMPADPNVKTSGCCSVEDFNDARRVCDSLEIPFYAMNFKKAFEEKVIHPFVSEYLMGRTPNPCVLCNSEIKFDAFLAKAEELGADAVATGHYAQIQKENGSLYLLKGKDPKKDQSYFLFSLGQKELSRILFPVGHLIKEEVRAIAREFNLKTKDKPESQEICFVPNDDPAAFIEKYTGGKTGPVGNFVDESGAILGQHRGVHCYTLGQRRGIQVAMGKRFYVKQINVQTNEIILAEDFALYQSALIAKNVTWVEGVNPQGELQAKIRYRHAPEACEVSPNQENWEVKFKEAQRAITPGQAIVFYSGEKVLGGGWIEKAL